MAGCLPTKPAVAMFYLNIQVENKASIVEKQVFQKLGTSALGEQNVFHKVTKDVGRLANEFVSADEVTNGVADGVMQQVPDELRQKGIIGKVTKRFQRGSYVVLSVRIVSADWNKLAEDGVITSRTHQLLQCFEFLPASIQSVVIGGALQRLALGVCAELPANTTRQLAAQGGVRALVTGQPAEEQAAYMFDVLEEMDRKEQEARQAHPQPMADLQKGLEKAVSEYTGHPQYKFGDITKKAVQDISGHADKALQDFKGQTEKAIHDLQGHAEYHVNNVAKTLLSKVQGCAAPPKAGSIVRA